MVEGYPVGLLTALVGEGHCGTFDCGLMFVAVFSGMF